MEQEQEQEHSHTLSISLSPASGSASASAPVVASASAKRRHLDTDDDPLPLPPTGRARRMGPRKRAAMACEECRVRKRRCDGGIPSCAGCEKRRSACIYSSEIDGRIWYR